MARQTRVDQVIAWGENDSGVTGAARYAAAQKQRLRLSSEGRKRELCDDRGTNPMPTARINDIVTRLGAYVRKDLTAASETYRYRSSAEILKRYNRRGGVPNIDY